MYLLFVSEFLPPLKSNIFTHNRKKFKENEFTSDFNQQSSENFWELTKGM